MYTLTITRRGLLDLVQSPASMQMELNSERGEAKASREESVYKLVWDRHEPQGELPNCLLIPNSEQDDFLAWAYTYLAGLRPLTAFIRIVDPEAFDRLSSVREHRSLENLREACAGLVIGEALSYLEPNTEHRFITPTACGNTQTFALARAFVLGIEGRDDEILNAWYGVRELTRQNVASALQEQVRGPWEVLLRLAGGKTDEHSLEPSKATIAHACRELLDFGDIRADTWFRMTSAFHGMDEVRDKMVLSRESRVKAFENVLPGLAKAYEEDGVLAAFIAGYIGSRIAPGEMEHVMLFFRPLPFASNALLWFSLCAGLQARGQVLSFLDGLGRRVLRDLDQPDSVMSRPKSDLAYPELRVLFGREKKLSEFRTSSSNALNVELLPGVTTSVRWPRSNDSQTDLFEKREGSVETRQLLAELSFSLDRANDVRRRLERTLGGGASSQRYVPEKRSRK